MQISSVLRHATLISLVSCAPWSLASSHQDADLVRRAGPVPTPLSLQPSEYWDGDDGKWSTFQFQVGTPAQQIRLIPGTSTSTLYFIAPQGCVPDSDSSSCPNDRGGTFNPSGSSTWAPLGSYQYQGNYSQTSLLGYLANSVYGDDVVSLGWPGSPLPTLQNQIVGGLAEKSIWYVGNFGISPRIVNITTLANSHPAPLQNLRDQNLIPSTTWAYTAGFFGNSYPVFGSLTLGGYDTTRFRGTGVSFPFGNDISRDLLVSIQGITTGSVATSGGLLPGGPINAYIDSTVPAIWLPLDACRAFERAFNLTWSDQSEYYLLSDEQHAALKRQNPTVTFNLGSSLAGGSTVDIVLPYAAFDLNLSAPITAPDQPPQYYFPLQRAQNLSQYVLGRTFLQQAYVIADYDRSNFTVAQALFPQQNVKPNVVSIYPPGSGPNGSANETTTMTKTTKSVSGGGIAGIVIGVVALLVLIALAILLWRRSVTKKNKKAETAKGEHESMSQSPGGIPGFAGGPAPGISTPTHGQPPEYGAFEKAELENTATGTPIASPGSPMSNNSGGDYMQLAGKTELPGQDRNVHEAPDTVKAKTGELDSTPTVPRQEMDASQEINEMDGDSVDGGKKKEGDGGGGSSRGGRGSGPVYEMPG